MEHRVGADIYIGIRVMRGSRVEMSKGMLAQAKLWPYLSADGRVALIALRRKMLARSPASYVWVYTPEGVGVVNAEDVVRRESRNLTNRRRLDQPLSEVLACNEGDPLIGLPAGTNVRRQVGTMLEELGARTGIGVSITADR